MLEDKTVHVKKIRYQLFLSIFLILCMSCYQKKKVFRIPDGHIAMFGYGSLMSKKFIQTGLLQKNYQGPFLSAHLKGFKRSWTFAWPSTLPSLEPDGKYYRYYYVNETDTVYPKLIHYLNIIQDSNTVINGVLYIVPKADLTTYDSWELGYERIDVTDMIQDYTIEGGPVFAYRALADFVVKPTNDPKQHLIELSYSNILMDAFHFWGKEFEKEYKNSTEPFDSLILKDSHKTLWTNPPLEKIIELKSIFK